MLSALSETEILKFALVFLRVMALILSWPIFSANNIPAPVKVLLTLVFSICLFPTIKSINLPHDLLSESIISLAVKELLIGLALGYTARLFFFAVSISGQIISISSGFASAQIFNPTLGQSSHVLEEFQWILASLLFLILNGHHTLIETMAISFDKIPLSMESLKLGGLGEMALIGQNIMILGIKMAAPILVSTLVASVALGVLSRAVPQINIFSTSMQVTAILSLLILFISIPMLIPEMNILSQEITAKVFSLMKTL